MAGLGYALLVSGPAAEGRRPRQATTEPGINIATGNAGRDINVRIEAPAPGAQPPLLLYTHAQFWEAITLGDAATTERYIRSGMKLKPDHLQTYFLKYFSPATFQVLAAGHALAAAGCPTDAAGLGFYASVGQDPVRSAAVRSVCGNDEVRGALNDQILRAEAQIRSADEAARTVSRRVDACIAKMRTTSTDAWLQRASTFSIVGPTTYTLEQEILVDLNIALLTGRIAPSARSDFVARTIAEKCRRQAAPPSADLAALRRAREAMAVLASRP